MKAVDLFAGAGGATQGLRDAGFDVVAAVELDPDAAATWSLNHPGKMLVKDVREVTGPMLMAAGGFKRGELDLLKACPPCQGFSSLRGASTPDESRNDLVLDTLRLVRSLRPRAVLIENVPGLRKDGRFVQLAAGIRQLGYNLQDYLVNAHELGVPQRRKRLVVIAVRGVEVPSGLDELIPGVERRAAMTAGEALAALPQVEGEPGLLDAPRRRNATVMLRIAAVPVGGNRFALPLSLQLECHKRLTGKDGKAARIATSSYGRVVNENPAPTMTTRCTTPACGSFIHPTENRGITLREAAAFQTFPASYQWSGTYGSVERQIGNAVPVWMAESLGRAVGRLLGYQAQVMLRTRAEHRREHAAER
ncbi:DNA cytosine methyltransferase [Cellulomonas dongxiuzhuiae]|uniref:Cytosine-specific methyltransferase n=1 Tax=Cellulomonas dongxiuzhuiae TaxID=2819979 RepID=A0ABX8GK22_9CELL|nr:DNA cytosine methyltransferase [Cellulomonas dongxiuzhuiae]MBO3095555.1 DNA cytosine methyltransferase [Cellulomonas dongxiuzhuiae]QWC16527.1 DNA cytosine methyltransferase [Cellulomonas dongxiuzhuiae]